MVTQQEIREPTYDLQHVVDLMRNAAGKRTDQLHALCLVEPCFQLARGLLRRESFSDVPDDEVRGWPTLVHEGNHPDFNLEISAVEPMQGIANWRSERHDIVVIREVRLDALKVRWVKDRVDRQADDLRTRCRSGEPDGRRVGENHPFTVMNEYAVGSQLDKLFKAFPDTRGVAPTRVQNHPNSVGEPLVRCSAE